MSRVPVQLKITPDRPVPKWWQSLQQTYQQVAQIINGNVNLVPPNGSNSLGTTGLACDNIAAVACQYTTGTVGSDDVLTHNLGRVPFGYVVVGKNATVDVYNSPSAWTATNIYLRSTVSGVVVRILVF